jgi:hypothetical protein
METLTEGSVTVDSNVGSAADLQAEHAAETPRIADRRGRLTDLKAPEAKPVVEAADADEAAEETAEVPAADASEAGKTLGKKKKSLQARIDEISGQAYRSAQERDEARATATRLQNELDELRGTRRPATKDQPAAKIVGGVALDAKAFPKYAQWLETAPATANDLEDWVEARDTWKEARADERRAAETATRQAATSSTDAFKPIADAFHERMAPALKAEPEFYKQILPELMTTHAASALPPGAKVGFLNFIVDQAFQSEAPKDVLLWLSKPDTLRRLATLKPDAIIREFAKIDASHRPANDDATGPLAEGHDGDDDDEDPAPVRRGSAPARSVETATSLASAPVKPVRGSSQQSADREPGDDASDDEWLRYQKRQARRR